MRLTTARLYTDLMQQLKQHDLMSLEMAQYEATLCGLQTQVSDLEAIVSERDEKVNDLVKQISELNGDRKVVEEVRAVIFDYVVFFGNFCCLS